MALISSERWKRAAEIRNENDNEDQSIKMDNKGSRNKEKEGLLLPLLIFLYPLSDFSFPLFFFFSPLHYVTAPPISS